MCKISEFLLLKTSICCPFFHIEILMCFIKKNVFSIIGEQGHRCVGSWKPLLTCGNFFKLFVCHKCIAKGHQDGKDQ